MSSPTGPHSSHILSDAVLEEMIQKTTVVMNVAQSTIIVTEDKVRLCLLEHAQRIKARDSWIAPAGVLAAIGTTLITATFKDIIVSAATWKAIYIIAAILTGVWAVKTAVGALKAPSVDDIVGELKRAGSTHLVASATPDPGRHLTSPVALSFPTSVNTVLQCENCGTALPPTGVGVIVCSKCGKSYGGK